MLFTLLLITFTFGVICGVASTWLCLGYLHRRGEPIDAKIDSDPLVLVTVVSASSFSALGQ